MDLIGCVWVTPALQFESFGTTTHSLWVEEQRRPTRTRPSMPSLARKLSELVEENKHLKLKKYLKGRLNAIPVVTE